MKPNVIVVGKSGSGKSTSLRNLNPERTAVLNTERKQLPFKGANKFMKVPVTNLAVYKTEFKFGNIFIFLIFNYNIHYIYLLLILNSCLHKAHQTCPLDFLQSLYLMIVF